LNATGATTASLTKIGTGTLTLSNTNTYGGGTTINAGTLLLTNASGAGTATITLAGGTLATNTGGDTTLSNAIVAAASSSSAITAAANELYLSGNLTGSGSISFFASTGRTVSLSGSNSGFTGTIICSNDGSRNVGFTSVGAGSTNAAWVLSGSTSSNYGLVANFGTGTVSLGSLQGTGVLWNYAT
jgi:autotransporter-associated beta strand protein